MCPRGPKSLATDVAERRLVANAGERLAREVRKHLGVLAEHPLDQGPGDDEDLVGRAVPRTYSISAPAATAACEISVQGVVVQTSRLSPDSTGDSGIWSLGGTSVTGSRT